MPRFPCWNWNSAATLLQTFSFGKFRAMILTNFFQTHESITIAMNVIAYEPSLAAARQLLARNKEWHVGKGFCHMSHSSRGSQISHIGTSQPLVPWTPFNPQTPALLTYWPLPPVTPMTHGPPWHWCDYVYKKISKFPQSAIWIGFSLKLTSMSATHCPAGF